MLSYVIIIIVLILLYLTFKYGKHSTEMNLLQGFWESCRDFNNESGLKLLSFYIGDKDNGLYPAYLLMIENDEDNTILINEPIQFVLSQSITNILSNSDCKEMTLRFIGLETSLMPKIVNIKYYPHTSKLVISDNKKIYAILFRNPVLCELERIKSERPVDLKSTYSKSSDIA